MTAAGTSLITTQTPNAQPTPRPAALPATAKAAPPADEFSRAFGEHFAHTLDLASWRPGEDLVGAYARIEREVAEAVAREDDLARRVRAQVFPALASLPEAPPCAGVFSADARALEQVHKGLLFTGQVEASNGMSVVHQTLPLCITQIGVCLVSYQGKQGVYAQRLFRRDLREAAADPVSELFDVLERRDRNENEAELSDLARRGIMHYGERALLKEQSNAAWRMGHGHVLPFEMLSGFWAAHVNNLRLSLDLFAWYASFGRFVFVPQVVRRRHLLTIGNALRPGEYAIIENLQLELERLIGRGHYRHESGVRPALETFYHELAPSFVSGVYRVSAAAPAHVFYAHVDHAHTAAHIAMADSMLHEVKGSPMLLGLADLICRSALGADSLLPAVQVAYADASQPMAAAGYRDFGS